MPNKHICVLYVIFWFLKWSYIVGKNFDCQLDDVVGRFEKIEQNIYLDQNH